MYRINNISKQIVKLQVQKDTKLREVTLMPGNFVLTEAVTQQMKNLENSRVIRVREINGQTVQAAPKVEEKKHEQTVTSQVTPSVATDSSDKNKSGKSKVTPVSEEPVGIDLKTNKK